ncbi:hypothetical protein Tco_0771630 [Tanacetum coccineum]|uniref:Uncharacterized protein n=1 Tax=Tanacetum coccineum TaxID=301880 RepID=A0ABQ4ZFK1_9ASTR
MNYLTLCNHCVRGYFNESRQLLLVLILLSLHDISILFTIITMMTRRILFLQMKMFSNSRLLAVTTVDCTDLLGAARDLSIMGTYEEVSTIPEKESDEVIKSSVEDFVPIPSESEDTSGSDSDCDLPSYNDFSPINISE